MNSTTSSIFSELWAEASTPRGEVGAAVLHHGSGAGEAGPGLGVPAQGGLGAPHVSDGLPLGITSMTATMRARVVITLSLVTKPNQSVGLPAWIKGGHLEGQQLWKYVRKAS